MAIVFVAQTNNVVSTAVASPTLTLTVPTGTLDGDLMVSLQGWEHDSPGTTLATPAGWTKVGEWASASGAGTGCKTALYYRYASGEVAGTTTYSFTSTNSALVRCGGGIATYSGVVATNPEDAAAVSDVTAAATSSAIVGGITTATDGAWVVGGNTVDVTTAETITTPSGFVERWQVAGRRTQDSDQERATAGSTGTVTWTSTPGTNSVPRVAVLWALRPDAGGAAPPPPVQGPRIWQPRYRRVA